MSTSISEDVRDFQKRVEMARAQTEQIYRKVCDLFNPAKNRAAMDLVSTAGARNSEAHCMVLVVQDGLRLIASVDENKDHYGTHSKQVQAMDTFVQQLALGIATVLAAAESTIANAQKKLDEGRKLNAQ